VYTMCCVLYMKLFIVWCTSHTLGEQSKEIRQLRLIGIHMCRCTYIHICMYMSTYRVSYRNESNPNESNAKETCIHAKQTFIHAKETCIPTKETCIYAKETLGLATNESNPNESNAKKTCVHVKETCIQAKEALGCKRDLYTRKKDPWTRHERVDS